jgi:Na+-transporting methylmalonyl-CoA/oxaloacetate decarboxylase gamma subunit
MVSGIGFLFLFLSFSIVLMLDLGSLLISRTRRCMSPMAITSFYKCSDKHPEHVFLAMRNVLSLVIEEGEEVSSQILEIILNNLLRQKEVL